MQRLHVENYRPREELFRSQKHAIRVIWWNDVAEGTIAPFDGWPAQPYLIWTENTLCLVSYSTTSYSLYVIILGIRYSGRPYFRLLVEDSGLARAKASHPLNGGGGNDHNAVGTGRMTVSGVSTYS